MEWKIGDEVGSVGLLVGGGSGDVLMGWDVIDLVTFW